MSSGSKTSSIVVVIVIIIIAIILVGLYFGGVFTSPAPVDKAAVDAKAATDAK